MAEQDDSSEKSLEPSQRKLDEARKKGEIPRAPDLTTATAYLGLLLALLAIGARAIGQFADALLPMIEQPDRLDDILFRPGASPFVATLLWDAMLPVLIILSVPSGAVLLSLIATRGVVVTPTKLTLKFQRLSILDNAKNKFGRRGLFEFFKSFTKLIIFSAILAIFLWREMAVIVGSPRGNPAQVIQLLGSMLMRFLSLVVVVSAVMGVIDFLWQRAEHLRKNRMSQKEMRDEMKDSEGDPMMKQKRRNKAQEIAMNQMMSDVPGADVVIVNPTHYAIALTWSRMPGEAPVCVAKGVDEIAARIREVARDSNVPIHSDPPTARALFATTDIGREIKTEHYKPVAAAIRFAEDMRARARRRSWS